jgi:hypothetical protein
MGKDIEDRWGIKLIERYFEYEEYRTDFCGCKKCTEFCAS